jgi:hypothetical protein
MKNLKKGISFESSRPSSSESQKKRQKLKNQKPNEFGQSPTMVMAQPKILRPLFIPINHNP